MRGYLKKWTNFKYGTVDTLKLIKTIENEAYRKVNNNSENIRVFEETLSLLKANNISVILLYIPTIDKLEKAQSENFDKTIRIFKDQEGENVEFINFQEPWSHRYDLFYDPIHLNPEGQKIITHELIKILKKNY